MLPTHQLTIKQFTIDMPISLQELSLLEAYLPEWYSTEGNLVARRYLVTSEHISGSTFEGKGWMVVNRDLGAVTAPHDRELTCLRCDLHLQV